MLFLSLCCLPVSKTTPALSKKADIEKTINSILFSETEKNCTEHSSSFNRLRSNGGKESYGKSKFGELYVSNKDQIRRPLLISYRMKAKESP